MNNLIWVGQKGSETDDCKAIFQKRIVLYGVEDERTIVYKDSSNQRINHLDNNQRNKEFWLREINKEIQKDSQAKFMFYSQRVAHALSLLQPNITQNLICVNDKSMLDLIENKIHAKTWLNNSIPILPYVVLTGKECSYQRFVNLFSHKYNKYVIQLTNSSGGYGTYLVTIENCEQVIQNLNLFSTYIVSPYIGNSISVNQHLLIYDDAILTFPGSMQIVINHNYQLLYKGGDYIEYRNLNQNIKSQISNYTAIVGEKLKNIGYRGICGIDYIISGESIYFLEVNARFQASSFLLNRSLIESNHISLPELNIMACNHEPVPSINNDLNIKYSFYKYSNYIDKKHVFTVFETATSERSNYICEVVYDGFSENQKHISDCYLYQIVFNTNICSVNFDYSLDICPNIFEYQESLEIKDCQDFAMKVKFALLNQGVAVSDDALKFSQKNGTIRNAVFNAYDIKIFKNLRVNCPVSIKLAEISPFKIDYSIKTGLQLLHTGKFISDVRIDLNDTLSYRKTQNGIPFERIGGITTDRLRIRHKSGCYFKDIQKSCGFCVSRKNPISFSDEDILEFIDNYIEDPTFRHILIGGGSDFPDMEIKNILVFVEYLRKKTDAPIYVMCLPPDDVSDIIALYKSGVNEVAFNIEIFDRSLAEKIMPGKGSIPLEQYYNALNYSVKLWGNNGNVRTALIAGLNSTQAMINGVESLCKIGVQPMISIFRPMPNTILENKIQPNNSDIYNLYSVLQSICNKYNLRLGPSCFECQNNTLSYF